MAILSDISNVIISDGLDAITGTDVIDTIDFSGVTEGSVGGAFNGVIVDLDINSAGANGTPSQDGAILDNPPAAGGTQIDNRALTDIENIIGSAFDDGLFGNNEINILLGGDGADVIHGFAGDDFLAGGAGIDTVVFAAAPAGVFVDLNLQLSEADFEAALAATDLTSFAATGAAGNNILSGFENVTGSQSSDTLVGGSADNIILANDGDDFIGLQAGDDNAQGGGGNDSLFASAGDDILLGNAGDDQIFGNLGIDSVNGGSGNDLLFGGDGADTVQGEAGDDTIFGGAGDDAFLSGGSGFDIVRGGAGDDIFIDGGTGDDTLFGGEGADTFFFNQATGDDVIADFENGTDFVNVEAFNFASIEELAAAGSQVGDDVVIQLDEDDTLTILNVVFDDLLPEFFII